MIKNKALKKRIIEISYKLKLSHIGSCLASVDIINDIYARKKSDEKFVLSAGHSHLAQLVVKELEGEIDFVREQYVETLIENYGIHCDRQAGCDVSTGSLGHGIGIALGMALADRSKNVYCVISDGECAEGSVWEALRIQKDYYVDNLFISCLLNGYGAYGEINQMALSNKLEYDTWCNPVFINTDWYPKWLQGQQAHYKILNKEEYEEIMEILK
jgi:transketolase